MEIGVQKWIDTAAQNWLNDAAQINDQPIRKKLIAVLVKKVVAALTTAGNTRYGV